MTAKRLPVVLTALAMLCGASAAAPASTVKACGSVSNPYAGTRYEGVDLSRITGAGITCAAARRVARGAHRKAIGLTPPRNGVRLFTWHGWHVSGDLRPSKDVYTAIKPGRTVTWKF